MAAYIQRPDGSALYFDLTEDERHGGVAEVTKYPVEEGPEINDHVRVMPSPFSMKCFVSNAPLAPNGNYHGGPGQVSFDITPFKPQLTVAGAITSAVVNPVGAIASALTPDPGKQTVTMPVLRFANDFNAPMDTFFILQDMQDKSELLTVFTSIAEYSNMVLERFEVIRDAGTGTGAEVELNFVPVRIVQTQTAPTPITTQPAAKPVKKAGKKDPEEDVVKASIADNFAFGGK